MAGKDMAVQKRTGKTLAQRQEWLSPLDTLRQEMNRLMDSFFQGFGAWPFELSSAFTPRLDIIDTEKTIDVAVELPGMDEKDVDVSITKDQLTIKGEKKEEKEEKGKSYYKSERSFGSFVRTVPIPEGIDTEGVQAVFKNGVLTVKLPKTKEAMKEAKKISVRTE